MPNKRKLIIDVDTGTDDAIAISLACLSNQFDILGICTVSGSRPVDKATDNTLRLLKLLQREEIPVYVGSKGPIVKDIYPDRLDMWQKQYRPVFPALKEGTVKFHPDFDYLPETTKKAKKISAVEFYLKTLRETDEKITILATGPFTNLAIALRIDDEICNNIEQIVVMGGGYSLGNVSSSAESNIYRDPEAASRLLQATCKVTFIPLDATHQAYITEKDVERIEAYHHPITDFIALLSRQRIFAHTITQPLEQEQSAAIHDALALCYLIDENVCSDVKYVHMEIGLRDFSDGQTIIDPRYYPEKQNCYFAFKGNRTEFMNLIFSILDKALPGE